jgi:hypothetical protein
MTAITPTVGSLQGIGALKIGCQIGGTTISTGSGTPSATMTALRIGDLYVDYTYGAVYLAAATGSGSWMRIGLTSTSAAPLAINTANDIGLATYWSTSATSGTTYGRYNKLTASGIGVEAIGGRDRVILTAAAGNAHGVHHTLEVTSTGYVTGLGTAVRGNIVFGTDTVVPAGTYYAVMGEIYAAGNVSSMPTSNACLCCSVPAGTEIDKVANAIAFSGTDSATSMIYSATDATPDWTGSIRILVNGAIRYLHFTSAAAS